VIRSSLQPLPFRGGEGVGNNVGSDRKLVERARSMRREPTEFEKRLWRHVSRSQLGGFKFRRQATLDPFIVDFFCPAKGLIVEVDGETHVREEDRRRDAALARRGFSTIRFTNDQVGENMDGVLIAILERLRSLPDRWPRGGPDFPTPTPPLKGRG
jgi:very-short-patch-repair endonuclease